MPSSQEPPLTQLSSTPPGNASKAIALPPGCARSYRLERPLSEGGFGAVLLATQLKMGRPVAIKLLHSDHLTDPEQVQRFSNEARITAQLSHPNIVTIIDFDVEDGVPWIAYEFLPGKTLHQKMAGGKLPWKDAVRACADVLAGLDAAHGRGVLHRDIKPQNVMESHDGSYKVTDFGIAKWSGRSAVKTRTGVLIGTPAYLAPELIRGEEAGAAADLYSVGVLLFELVAGRPPFTDDSPVITLQHHLKSAPPDLRTLEPEIPPELARVVASLLAKAPAGRPASARAARATLAQIESASLRGPGVRSRGEVNASPREEPRARPANAAGAGPARLAFAIAVAAAGGFVAGRHFAATTPSATASASPTASSSPDAPATVATEWRRSPAAEVALCLIYARFDVYVAERHEDERLAGAGGKVEQFWRLIQAIPDTSTDPEFALLAEKAKDFRARRTARVDLLTSLARDAAQVNPEGSPDAAVWTLLSCVRAELFAAQSEVLHAGMLLQRLKDIQSHPADFATPDSMGRLAEMFRYPPEVHRSLDLFLEATIHALHAVAERPEGCDPRTGNLFWDLHWIGKTVGGYSFRDQTIEQTRLEVGERLTRSFADVTGKQGPEILRAALEAWNSGINSKSVKPEDRPLACERIVSIGEALPKRTREHMRVCAERIYPPAKTTRPSTPSASASPAR